MSSEKRRSLPKYLELRVSLVSSSNRKEREGKDNTGLLGCDQHWAWLWARELKGRNFHIK